jgi:polyisoprenoid-binding protein YceI
MKKRWLKWVIAAVVVIALIPTLGVWIYINFIKDDPPEELSFDNVGLETTTTTEGSTATTATDSSTATTDAPDTTTASTTPTTAAASTGAAVDGTWTITDGSQVGYRVVEVLFGQDTEGVGRTGDITGQVEISGTQVTTGSFEVDMTTVESDESRRDSQFNGRLMDTSTFPTATFTLTSPIELGSIPAEGQAVTATATGDLTLRGVTKSVTFDVQAQLTSGTIEIIGSTDIVFTDYSIPQPDTNGISTQDHGLLEIGLVLTKA